MAEKASSATRLPRAWCPWCHREVAAYVPSGGDGSGLIYRAHNLSPGVACPGWARSVDRENER